jgi:hypothetical protein
VTLVDPARLPDAAGLVASTVFEAPAGVDDPSVDPDFAFGLELILDGTSAAIHRADAGARPTVES